MTPPDLQTSPDSGKWAAGGDPACRRALRALTVLELMLVMVVLAVLLVLTVSALSTLKDRAVTAACAGKMRQLGAAFHAYAGEHRNEFPVQEQTLPGKMKEPGTWANALHPYTGSYHVMYCPTGDRVRTIETVKNSYLYNSYVALHLNPNQLTVVKRTASKEPSRDVVLIDAYSKSTGSSNLTEVAQAAIAPIFKAPWTWFPHSTDLSEPILQPSASRNVLYVDGHVERLRAVPGEAIALKHWRWPLQ
ncbi:MAG TPA: hypothetical protein VNQ90_12965 [Chthoniobacteraceae bacterium]|nr:hypothetical protein [Chthoniobacteraceae bacterium]